MSFLDLSVADAATLRLATVTIQHPDILTLPTTPVELIPAPGGGKRIIPIQWDLWADFTAGAYTNIGLPYSYLNSRLGGIEYSSYMADDPTAFINEFEAFFNTASLTHAVLTTWNPVDLSWGPLVYPENAAAVLLNGALDLFVENSGAGNFTGGNVANTLKVRVLFFVVED